jgi:hypothetical protein
LYRERLWLSSAGEDEVNAFVVDEARRDVQSELARQDARRGNEVLDRLAQAPGIAVVDRHVIESTLCARRGTILSIDAI